MFVMKLNISSCLRGNSLTKKLTTKIYAYELESLVAFFFRHATSMLKACKINLSLYIIFIIAAVSRKEFLKYRYNSNFLKNEKQTNQLICTRSIIIVLQRFGAMKFNDVSLQKVINLTFSLLLEQSSQKQWPI